MKSRERVKPDQHEEGVVSMQELDEGFILILAAQLLIG
jgi:hypothetical protein